MNLDDTQMAQVRKWIDEEFKLSEIQTKLASELGVSLTYMETRLLMDDLKLQPQDNVEPAEAAEAAEPVEPQDHLPRAGSLPGNAQVPLEEPVSKSFLDAASDNVTEPGDVSINVDQVTRAGAMVSGGVQFSDGKKADWYLDQYGRLAIAPKEEGYKPSQADLMLFQGELQSELSKMGY